MAAAGTACTVIPGHTVSGFGHVAPSDKLNIVGVGIGGKGRPNLRAMNTENIIGLCDVDWKYSQGTFDEYPKAKRYWDWRKMFDELEKSIDAVLISTPDHTHAIIAAAALSMGKHVYCQKPLTHSVYESRLLTKLAAKYKVATQMGNQGNSGEGVRQVCEWIWNGEIGDVTEVHAWTNRPNWPLRTERPKEQMTPPDTLNWDLFIGPASFRPYHEIYTPWDWRGWWAFGTGAFGDMACHVLDPVYQALRLGNPSKVQGSSTQFTTECTPQAETVGFVFPGRRAMPKVNFPEVKVHWYDGGIFPSRPDLLPDGVDLMADGSDGCIFVGSKDILVCSSGGFNAYLLSGRNPSVAPYLRRIPGANRYRIDGPHEQDWIRACKESPENRVEGTSNFSYSGPLNEMVLLGVLAIRLKNLKKILLWDAKMMQFTNISENEELKVAESNEVKIIDGHPHSTVQFAKFNAKEAANEYIRHTYRDGWSLPEMPV